MHTLPGGMIASIIFILALFSATAAATAADDSCPCGWRDNDSGRVYTHRIFQDFSQYPDVRNLLHEANGKAKPLMDEWLIYDF